MDRKATGVTDIVANLVTEDGELQKAAQQLQEKRNREMKLQAASNQPKKEGAQSGTQPKPKLVPPPKKPSIKAPSARKPKESHDRKRSKQAANETRWSNPTSALNTRIPPEMDQLLDDHVAKKKRQWKLDRQQGKKPTKQTIVQAALEGYFKSVEA